jgi:Tat protein translocase TatB subunit
VYLFILESIGTSELILIGIIALIFLGPRKLPQIARKIGKVMAEFRSTTSDFKQTWEREVNFDEEAKAFRVDEEEPKPVERVNSILPDTTETVRLQIPEVKEIDAANFKKASQETESVAADETLTDDVNDKKNWL